ncbi:hypothetical protein D3C76_1413230 [compost metagenome]
MPGGFPLERVVEQFEKRAACVLSDFDEPANLERWLPDTPHKTSDQYDCSFDDGRYIDVGVRQAWMMYLDLALEHFDRFGTVV